MNKPNDATGNSGTKFCSTLPRAMVLVYQPELTHSVWQDWISNHRTLKGMEQRLKQGVRNGEWVAWRLMRIEKEVMGNI